jgi:HAD superfamily hydrolase (TIGR01509 family)
VVIPWREIETVFLDAGNTLVSIDFAWVAEELAARGVACRPDQLRRAEAGARPALSRRLAAGRSTEGRDSFAIYLAGILAGLAPSVDLSTHDADALVDELVPVLRVPGQTERLWSFVLPRVREGLGALRAAGLDLIVVSNSDGSVERGIAEQGLRDYFSAVVDSHFVGAEKPDPAIFEHALEVAGAAPERTLHVGDMYAADVVGARAAGLHALLLDPFDDWTDVDCACTEDLWTLSQEFAAAGRGSRGGGS